MTKIGSNFKLAKAAFTSPLITPGNPFAHIGIKRPPCAPVKMTTMMIDDDDDDDNDNDNTDDDEILVVVMKFYISQSWNLHEASHTDVWWCQMWSTSNKTQGIDTDKNWT